MRRSALVAAALLALAGCGAAPPADGGAKALVRRAVRAMGGEEALSLRAAVRRKVTMKVSGLGAGGGRPTMRAEMLTQPGGRPTKVTTELDLGGSKTKVVMVLDGDRSWQSVSGTVQPLPAEQRDAMRLTAHVERVVGLVALRKEKRFTLTPLGETKVGGKPARGVKVSYKGKPDVELYFDKSSGLLVKYSHKAKVLPGGPESRQEVVLSDYRRPDPGAGAERVLKRAKVGTDGASLLAFLRRHRAAGAGLVRARELVKKLGSEEFEEREKAESGLVALGAVALPALQEAARSTDLEVRRRAQRCLKKLGPAKKDDLLRAAVRLAAVRRPRGAVEALLDCLPGADAPAAEEIRAALAALAQEGGKPHPALVKALADTDPAKRAAAREVLGKDGGAYLKRPGRRLFLRGPLQAMKQVQSTALGGATMAAELESTEVEYFNAFDEKEFAKP